MSLPITPSAPVRRTDCGWRETFPMVAAVVLFALVLYLPGLGSVPLIDRDEPYYASVSREMLDRGDFMIPRFNGRIWLEKPPMLYWAQSLAFRFLGATEAAARLPSALAGAATAAVVFAMALSMFGDPRAALRAGMISALSPAILAASRLGMTDMILVFFTTLASWAAWELLRPDRTPRPARWWWIFYVAIGAGILTKGPSGLLPLMAAGVYIAWARPPGAMQSLCPLRGAVVITIVAGAWYGPVMAASGGALVSDFFLTHVVERVLRPSNGHGIRGITGYLLLLPLYPLLVIPAFFPWILWFPRAATTLWRARSSCGRFLLAGILLVIGLFSLASTKLPFYILPVFPLLACVVGPAVPARTFRVAAALITAAVLVGSVVVLPFLGGHLPARELARSQTLPPGTKLALGDSIEPGFFWYFGPLAEAPADRIGNEEISDFLQRGGPRAVVCVAGDNPPQPPPGTTTTSREGFNPAKGRWQTYLLITSPGHRVPPIIQSE